MNNTWHDSTGANFPQNMQILVIDPILCVGTLPCKTTNYFVMFLLFGVVLCKYETIMKTAVQFCQVPSLAYMYCDILRCVSCQC